MSEAEILTTEDLRNRMYEVLKKRGLVDVLKVSKSVYDGAPWPVLGYYASPSDKPYF